MRQQHWSCGRCNCPEEDLETITIRITLWRATPGHPGLGRTIECIMPVASLRQCELEVRTRCFIAARRGTGCQQAQDAAAPGTRIDRCCQNVTIP